MNMDAIGIGGPAWPQLWGAISIVSNMPMNRDVIAVQMHMPQRVFTNVRPALNISRKRAVPQYLRKVDWDGDEAEAAMRELTGEARYSTQYAQPQHRHADGGTDACSMCIYQRLVMSLSILRECSMGICEHHY